MVIHIYSICSFRFISRYRSTKQIYFFLKQFCFSLLASFMSLCNQTFNIPPSDASIIYTPSTSSSSCCNITLVSDSADQIMINIYNLSSINSSLKISNKQFEIIKFNNYLSSNRAHLKSDMIYLPITFSLCQSNLPSFEIVITNLTKGMSTFTCKSIKFIQIQFRVNIESHSTKTSSNYSRWICYYDYCFRIIINHWFS